MIAKNQVRCALGVGCSFVLIACGGGIAAGQPVGGRTFATGGAGVYLVDFETQTTHFLFDAGPRFPGAADSNRADSFYATTSPEIDYFTGEVLGESQLYRVNPYTQGLTPIGGAGDTTAGDPIGVRELAYVAGADEVWGVNWDANADGFYGLNPVTGVATEIGSHGLPYVFGLAYDPPTGQVVGSSHVNVGPEDPGYSDFVVFDTATGLPAGLVLPTGETRITDLWYDADAGVMRAVGNAPNRLLQVDTTSGAAFITSEGGEGGSGIHNLVGLGGQAITAPLAHSMEGIVSTTARARVPEHGDDPFEEETDVGIISTWGGGVWAYVSDYYSGEEEAESWHDTEIHASVEAQIPQDAGWAKIGFAAEYYSEGYSTLGEGEGSGEFMFDVTTGDILPGGFLEAPAIGIGGLAKPMLLSVGITETLVEYREWDEINEVEIPIAIWDNIDWSVEISDGTDTYVLSRFGAQTAALQLGVEDVVDFTVSFSGDTTSLTEEIDGNLRAELVVDFALLDLAAVSPVALAPGEPGTSAADPLLPGSAGGNEPWVFDPFTVTEEGIGVTTPVFVDPEVAVGYHYAVEVGDPLFAAVLLPALGDDLYDIYVVDELGELALLVEDASANELVSLPSVREFVVLGIEPEEMVDPYDPTAFVTGLLFANEGVPHLTMIPVTTELIPEPNALALGILVVLIVGAQRKRN
ncbi:MAG: hypothetical protein KDA57_07395 [Planctomycetales bacterium]|nr:hypothetical protein [Planctomycetales bacterium]